MRLRGQIVFSLIVALIAAWAILDTWGWPIKAALYPRVVGIPLLVLAVVEGVLSFKAREDREPAQATDVALSSSVAPEIAAHRTASMFAWLGGFFAAVVLLGFPLAVPLFVFAYLRGQAKERWVISAAATVLAWLTFYLLFVRLLHVPFGAGVLWKVMGR